MPVLLEALPQNILLSPIATLRVAVVTLNAARVSAAMLLVPVEVKYKLPRPNAVLLRPVDR